MTLKLALLLALPGLCFRQAWFDDYRDATAYIDRQCETADVAQIEATPIKGKPGLYGSPYKVTCTWE